MDDAKLVGDLTLNVVDSLVVPLQKVIDQKFVIDQPPVYIISDKTKLENLRGIVLSSPYGSIEVLTLESIDTSVTDNSLVTYSVG